MNKFSNPNTFFSITISSKRHNNKNPAAIAYHTCDIILLVTNIAKSICHYAVSNSYNYQGIRENVIPTLDTSHRNGEFTCNLVFKQNIFQKTLLLDGTESNKILTKSIQSALIALTVEEAFTSKDSHVIHRVSKNLKSFVTYKSIKDGIAIYVKDDSYKKFLEALSKHLMLLNDLDPTLSIRFKDQHTSYSFTGLQAALKPVRCPKTNISKFTGKVISFNKNINAEYFNFKDFYSGKSYKVLLKDSSLNIYNENDLARKTLIRSVSNKDSITIEAAKVQMILRGTYLPVKTLVLTKIITETALSRRELNNELKDYFSDDE